MKSYTIEENDCNQRLDKFVRKAVPQLPTSLLHKYLRLKRIKKNGKRATGADKLELGDVIELYINDSFFEEKALPFLNAPSELNIVYEDEQILLVDKAPGLLVHEDDSADQDTLINRILHYLYKNGAYSPEQENSFTPALCNRIDRNTGGIVIAAKTFEALQVLNQKIKDREITKLYLCLVHGTFAKKQNLLKGYHRKDAKSNTVRIFSAPVPGAKTALTKYRVLAEKNNISLLEIELLTGRTHQIRAHMASIGHPLLGDTKYGVNKMNQNTPFKFQALYSHRLVFSFTTDSGALAYLKGRSFEVKRVPFADYLATKE